MEERTYEGFTLDALQAWYLETSATGQLIAHIRELLAENAALKEERNTYKSELLASEYRERLLAQGLRKDNAEMWRINKHLGQELSK